MKLSSPTSSLVAVLLISGLATLQLACQAKNFAGKNGNSDASFFIRLRPRLGHLGQLEEFYDVYEEYFDHVTKFSMEPVSVNDWRRGRPTGKQCVVFLQDFQVKNYELSKPFDLIVLDACLDWILADPSEEDSEKKQDYDVLDSDTKSECDELANDSRLKEIYESTAFRQPNGIPAELSKKIHAFFLRILRINRDNPRNWCHSLWTEAYNDFIEDVYLKDCDVGVPDKCTFYGFKESAEDSYLTLISESAKENLKICYNVIQKQMISIMHKDYNQKSGLNLFVTSAAAKQAKSMQWGQEMVKILQIASGTPSKQPIKLSDVAKDLNNIKYNDKETVERFAEALNEFALQNVDLQDSIGDEKGLKRYRKAMTKLCLPYISPKEFFRQGRQATDSDEDKLSKKPFEFYNLIYNLIRLTHHTELYGIDSDKFEEDVLRNGWVPLYLATFACQIISTTWGTIDYTQNEEAFSVRLRPNAQVLLEDWPIDVLVDNLADDDDDGDSAGHSDSEDGGGGDDDDDDASVIGDASYADYSDDEDSPSHEEPGSFAAPAAPRKKSLAKSKSGGRLSRLYSAFNRLGLKGKSSVKPRGQSAPPEGEHAAQGPEAAAPATGAGSERPATPGEPQEGRNKPGLRRWLPKFPAGSSEQQQQQQVIQQIINIPQLMPAHAAHVSQGPANVQQFVQQSSQGGRSHQTVQQSVQLYPYYQHPAPQDGPAPAREPSYAPEAAGASAAPQRVPKHLMSLETIKAFKRLNGRYPQLPPIYRELYPELELHKDTPSRPEQARALADLSRLSRQTAKPLAASDEAPARGNSYARRHDFELPKGGSPKSYNFESGLLNAPARSVNSKQPKPTVFF